MTQTKNGLIVLLLLLSTSSVTFLPGENVTCYVLLKERNVIPLFNEEL